MDNKLLEMWKIKLVVAWLDNIFDTCFLAFIWLMNWRVFFWFYLAMYIIGVFGNSIIISKLEKELNG